MGVKHLLAGVALLAAGAGPAVACQGTGSPLLDDAFKTADPGWGRADNVAAFSADGLELKPPVGGSAWRTNRNFEMGRADLCVEVVNPTPLPTPANEETLGSVGVWFWGSDTQNFYTATITLDGKAAIDRLVNGKWRIIIPPVPAASIKTAAGAVNEIEIVTSDRTARFFVNGAMISQIQGQPPAGGGMPGVYGESGPTGTTWVFPRVRLY